MYLHLCICIHKKNWREPSLNTTLFFQGAGPWGIDVHFLCTPLRCSNIYLKYISKNISELFCVWLNKSSKPLPQIVKIRTASIL